MISALIPNPYYGRGIATDPRLTHKGVSIDSKHPLSLLAHCPAHAATPLINQSQLAKQLGIEALYIKDERQRMGIGSFKALGAAYAIASCAYDAIGEKIGDLTYAKTALAGQVFVTASAGNHGLSLAAGARIFGAKAVIYLPQTVPSAFTQRLETYGAEVRVEGEDYEAALKAATNAANDNAWHLLSDSSWVDDQEHCESGYKVMEGYLVMADELVKELTPPPTHIFLQAGVGGLAAAIAGYVRAHWQEAPAIYVVEPALAPTLYASIESRKPTEVAAGEASIMGRLDCRAPSYLALYTLAHCANYFMTLDDQTVIEAIKPLAGLGLATSPSGGAGYAALSAMATQGELPKETRALIILSEGEVA